MLLFWYEQMKADPRGWMVRIMNHIGHPVQEEKVDQLCRATEFQNFQQYSSMNRRKGIVGDWVNHFSEEQSKVWSRWIEENLDKIEIHDADIRKLFK